MNFLCTGWGKGFLVPNLVRGWNWRSWPLVMEWWRWEWREEPSKQCTSFFAVSDLVLKHQINECQKAFPGSGMSLLVLTVWAKFLRAAQITAWTNNYSWRAICTQPIQGSESINSAHLGSSVPFDINAWGRSLACLFTSTHIVQMRCNQWIKNSTSSFSLAHLFNQLMKIE